MDAIDRIGRAGAAGDEGHARLARQLAMRLGHLRRAVFVAAADRADVGMSCRQRVERDQKAFARHMIDDPRAVQRQFVGKDFGTFSHDAHPMTKGLAISSAVESQTALVWRNSRMPSMPFSRPMPLFL